MTINEMLDQNLENDIINLGIQKSFKEYLLGEAKQVNNIYHFTTLTRIIPILKENKLKIGNNNTLSFTRDFDLPRHTKGYFDDGFYLVRITIDGNKVSENQHIRPYRDNRYSDEREELMFSEIKNLKKFIKKIEILTTDNRVFSTLQIETIGPILKTHNIKYEFVRKFKR